MRVSLNGPGDPIPPEALPDPGQAEGDFVLELVTGNFIPADYIALGFAYYEVWCIGGAGGRGGDVGNNAIFTETGSTATLSPGDWTLWLELIRLMNPYRNYFPDNPPVNTPNLPEWDYDHRYLVPGNYPKDGGGTIALTKVEMEERANPGHKMGIATYTGAQLLADAQASQGAGGSGGGGGLHVVTGALADLPASVPVVVGAKGADGSAGQTSAHGAYTPLPDLVDYRYNLSGLLVGSHERRMRELLNYFNPKQYKYPAPRTSFPNPGYGGDGGFSSFNGALCRASGGKAGGPAAIWDHHEPSNPSDRQEIFLYTGSGGAGGKGNRATAGGGAVGGDDADIHGADGTWDGVIGSGGGGGRGGVAGNTGPGILLYAYYGVSRGIGEAGDPVYSVGPNPGRNPGNGGQGAYSFADTSVFGSREAKSKYIGGGGGGAHLGKRKFGSHAVGYLPQGAVLLRITKPV